MPGKTWKDLQKNSSHISAERQPIQTKKLSSKSKKYDRRNDEGKIIELAKQASPQLAKLLEKRKALENNLHNLSSGAGEDIDPRDAARFQVLTFAERQAQQRRWESKHERLRAHSTEIRRQDRSENSRSHQTQSTENSVTEWLVRRDTQRQNHREAARDRLSPLNDAARVGRQISSSLSNTSNQLRDLDRQLAEQGLNQEREELRSLGGGAEGKLGKVQSIVGKYTKMAEAPMRAVNKIDSFWKKRQQDISGPMDKTGSYFDRSRRRLSTRTGGSGDLFERMERNRKVALQRRREKRREEAKDEARRERARRNKRKKK